jgi:predicted nucleotidyltransferase
MTVLFLWFPIYNSDMESVIAIPEAVKQEINVLTDVIVKTVPVEEIYLFSSYAHGTPHSDSDLDLYVVLKDDTEMRELDAILEIGKAISRKKSMPVDILASKKNRFLDRKEAPTLERQIERQGIKVYG